MAAVTMPTTIRGEKVKEITPITLPNGQPGYLVRYHNSPLALRALKSIGKAALAVGKFTGKALWHLVPGRKLITREWNLWLSNLAWLLAIITITVIIARSI